MDPHIPHHYLAHIFVFCLVTYALAVVLWIIPLLEIAKKAGLHFSVALLTLVPGIGTLIAIYILAFSRWTWKTPTV